MKNFDAMAMNDEELDNVVGGARVNALNDVDRKFARENVTPIHGFAVTPEVAKVLNSLGFDMKTIESMSMAEVTEALTQSDIIYFGLDNVTGKGGNMAHILENKQ